MSTSAPRGPWKPAQQPSLEISLDIARGLAAMAVFFFHMHGMIAAISPALGSLARIGHLGVPVFFVISGYCMAASASQVLAKGGSAREFLRKRFLRIFPPYWASIGVILALPYLLALLSWARTGEFLSPRQPWMTLDLVDWLQFVTLTRVFFNEGPGLESAFAAVNIVYWTLAIEFQFYLVMYAALHWRRHYRPILLLTTALGVLALALPQVKSTGLFIGFWPMFALGLGLHGLLAARKTPEAVFRLRVGVIAPAIALVLVAFGTALAVRGSPLPWLASSFGDPALAFAALTAVVLWLLSDADHRLAARLRAGPWPWRLPLRFGVFLGTISYSVYLLHTKLYQLPATAARQAFPPDHPAHVLVVVAGTVLLSWLFYTCFERPFISRRTVRPPLQSAVHATH